MYGLFFSRVSATQRTWTFSELEIALEEKVPGLNGLKLNTGVCLDKEWSGEKKAKLRLAWSEASRVLHSLDAATYPDG